MLIKKTLFLKIYTLLWIFQNSHTVTEPFVSPILRVKWTELHQIWGRQICPRTIISVLYKCFIFAIFAPFRNEKQLKGDWVEWMPNFALLTPLNCNIYGINGRNGCRPLFLLDLEVRLIHVLGCSDAWTSGIKTGQLHFIRLSSTSRTV